MIAVGTVVMFLLTYTRDWSIGDIAETVEATTRAEAEARLAPTFTSENIRESC